MVETGIDGNNSRTASNTLRLSVNKVQAQLEPKLVHWKKEQTRRLNFCEIQQ